MKPRPLRFTDLYLIPCECGKTVESSTAETVCPDCGRRLEVQWQAEYKRPPASK